MGYPYFNTKEDIVITLINAQKLFEGLIKIERIYISIIMSNTIMERTISLKLPPRISLEFTPQGVSLKIPEDMLLMFSNNVSQEISRWEERWFNEDNAGDEFYRDLQAGDSWEGKRVVTVHPNFWKYAIKNNGGEECLDSSSAEWGGIHDAGEVYHADSVFAIHNGDRREFWKLPKFIPVHPVLRKGCIEFDKAVVDINKCIKLLPFTEGYREEMNNNFIIEFEQFMNK